MYRCTMRAFETNLDETQNEYKNSRQYPPLYIKGRNQLSPLVYVSSVPLQVNLNLTTLAVIEP